jgi:hypothetical protein
VKLLVPSARLPGGRGDLREFFASVRGGLVVEQSHQGQLYRMLRMFVDVPPRRALVRASGANPIQPGPRSSRACSAISLSQQRGQAQSIQPQE